MNERRKGDRRIPPAVAQHLVEERSALMAQVETLTEWYSNALDTIRGLEADRDRLKVIADNYSALNMDAQAELSALKARPSTCLALPDRKEPGFWPLTEGEEAHNSCLDEVARLNPCRAQSVSDGYALVPINLTESMYAKCHLHNRVAARVWKDLLAAAPSAQQKESTP